MQDVGEGFAAPDLPPALNKNLNEANKEVFGAESNPVNVGCGGSIPFMEIFTREFPNAKFMLTGCGFADSNAHGPNENLDIQFCAKLTSVIALMLSKIGH